MSSKSSVLFIIFFCLFFHVKAQDKSKSDHNALHPLHANLALIIGVLSVSFSVIFLLLAYARFCHVTMYDIMDQNVHHQTFHELIRSMSRFSGIDRAAIESLPFFTFASLQGSKEGLECAVCISRFEDTEILRLLPRCRHAFHINCIDKWLESHSSCPLCRYKFNLEDLGSLTYSNSLRFLGNPSNLTDNPDLELVVQREQDRPSSSRFTNIDKGKKLEELLLREVSGSKADQKLFHKFKHRIIVSDVVIKNRWSDVNSSDLLLLNSQMLSVMSSNRFSRSNSTSGRFHSGFSINDHLAKIEDIERRSLYESKVRSHSVSTSSFRSTSYNVASSSKMLIAVENRSKSEITNFSRFRDFSARHKIKEAALGSNGGEEERKWRLWLPMVRRTVQWFAGQEKKSQELETGRQSLNV